MHAMRRPNRSPAHAAAGQSHYVQNNNLMADGVSAKPQFHVIPQRSKTISLPKDLIVLPSTIVSGRSTKFHVLRG